MGLEQIAVERQLKCEEVLSMISQSSESTQHHSGQASLRFEELLFTIPLFTALGQLGALGALGQPLKADDTCDGAVSDQIFLSIAHNLYAAVKLYVQPTMFCQFFVSYAGVHIYMYV